MKLLFTALIAALTLTVIPNLSADEAGDKVRHEKAQKIMSILDSYRASIPDNPPPRKLRIVYVVPNDMQPQPRYKERISGWMEDFADFCRTEFKRNGFAPHELNLERDSEGKIIINLVVGRHGADSYSYGNSGIVNDDIKAARPDLKFDENILMIICGFSRTLPDSSIRIFSPYYGIGPYSPVRGRCYLMDHEYLDIPNLVDTQTRLMVNEHHMREMTMAQFNVTYIGGAFHELGHGLTLPHNGRMPDESSIGHPLMGSGNYFYRAERKGGKQRTYLSFTEVARWVSLPVFSGCAKAAFELPKPKLQDYATALDSKTMTISGRIDAKITPYLVVVYADPGKELGKVNADYDAMHWTIIPEPDGSFKFSFPSNQLIKDLWQLRVVACFANGAFDIIVRQNYDKTKEIETPYRRP